MILPALLLLASPLMAQRFPYTVADPSLEQTLEFLDQEIQSLKKSQGTPKAGPPGPPGPKGNRGDDGAPGAAGTSALVAGSTPTVSAMISTLVIPSTDTTTNWLLTVATDGAPVLVTTATIAAGPSFLTYAPAVLTDQLTADNDGVIRMSTTSFSVLFPDLIFKDSGHGLWDVGLDNDGVLKVTSLGAY